MNPRALAGLLTAHGLFFGPFADRVGNNGLARGGARWVKPAILWQRSPVEERSHRNDLLEKLSGSRSLQSTKCASKCKGHAPSSSSGWWRNNVRIEFGLLASQPFSNCFDGALPAALAQGALPNRRHSPTGIEEGLVIESVTLDVATKFRIPELGTGFRNGRISASGMTMPEAAMNKYDRTIFGQHKIRSPRHPPRMKAIPETAGVKAAAQQNLGMRILPSDPRHHPRTGSGVDYIGHFMFLGMSAFGRRSVSADNIGSWSQSFRHEESR